MSSRTRVLAGRKVLITGAARGLGQSFALAAARAGAKVVVADILDTQETLVHLRDEGLHADAVTIDLNDPGAIDQAVDEAARKMGGLDGLVNNAAIATGIGGPTMEMLSLETWDRVMQVNVRGTWLVSRAALPYLRQANHGKIVMVASDTALWGAPRLMAYVASKGAVLAMTRAMAREVGKDGICVNAIAPGLTQCEATEYVPEERHRLYEDGRAIARAQVPTDIDGTVLYLLSSLSDFVTGQTLPVNGGFVFN
ncbi:SDR family oxidoreductase [Dyella caseinilytica]|uniref:SDR family oxidoreductase n=1 Tax=Dyella caseinilytica TaxID=1849581 RepID=A0ABX7GTU1_9GAMM|nr:SDR family oxidoreductase [Dyella caseinilytica]QRN53172.1 SDR family oxidoreductase [Dyella caseinilytica]GGA12017.1 short-chain dehydrogenase [Dyella caseinilytica]